ncbi:C-type lectin domain family 10 member A-like [Thunnus maccoyii]|uniref:C-type lectin domain family 10 member A-like n=1 Tax=Thunnus maccoyii TaxID=8240 RepID=UPI001C4C8300|nr:C-type lectin domain family 10 member A-like [Thunnus maccoyii]XP_042280700.1 C-type lectin domain family 10 member A-like [Thunnus maccoyii]
METGDYVNSPVDERKNGGDRKESNSGQLKLYRVVGVSFGFLCIIQTALNVSLWLQATEFCNRRDNISTGNFTPMSADDNNALIFEKDRLLQEKKQLLQEKKQLLQEKKQFLQEKDQLLQEKDQPLQEKKQLLQEKDQLLQEKDQLLQEKDQLLQEKDQLLQEKDQLFQEKDQLAKEKKELQHNNKMLKMLNETVSKQHNLIRDLRTKNEIAQYSSCPRGWWQYMSNCYQRSYMRKNWMYAKRDCMEKGAHLVILNDQVEEKAVRIFGGSVQMWIGLSHRKDTLTRSWTWVDHSQLTFPNWKDWKPHAWSSRSNSCAYVDQASSHWFLDACQRRYYWMCEKELNNRSS